MEPEQLESFNHRLNQWIANQGFWFQLRHSAAGGGGWGKALRHVLRMGLQALVLLLVVAAAAGYFLMKRVKSEGFVDSLNTEVAAGLSASQVRLVDFSRNQGEGQIRKLAVLGGRDSFFRHLEAGNIRFKMPLLAGLAGVWNAGTLQAKWMDLNVKTGADTEVHAVELGRSLFRQWETFDFASVEVEEATIRWGYTRQDAGRIERSKMVATRSPGAWRLSFSGGTFTQNWLGDMEIVSLVLDLSGGKMRVTEGRFRVGDGELVLKDVVVDGGDRPSVSGKMELVGTDLQTFVPEVVRPMVSGVISGELAISGSSNTRTGIEFEGNIDLSGDGVVSLGEGVELFRALALVDPFNPYRKVDFNSGGFHLKTGGGAMSVTRVDLKAGDTMEIQGSVQARYPTEEEVARSREQSQGQAQPNTPASVASQSAGAGRGVSATGEISLSQAANRDPKTPETNLQAPEEPDRREVEALNARLEKEEMTRRSMEMISTGSLRLAIPSTAFHGLESMRDKYAIEPGTGRILIEVPLEGNLLQVTRLQAEEIRRVAEQRERR